MQGRQTVFLECFARAAILTMAVSLLALPCAQPWDIQFGPQWDVIRNGRKLIELARHGILRHVHFGAPCQSLTWARDPQLRSAEWPWGLPNLLPHQQELVDMGNALVEFTALLCDVLHAAGASFSVENPEMSWVWLLAPVRRLRMLSGVVFSKVFFSDYLAD